MGEHTKGQRWEICNADRGMFGVLEHADFQEMTCIGIFPRKEKAAQVAAALNTHEALVGWQICSTTLAVQGQGVATMSKHTKGPWLNHEGHIMAPGGQTVAIVDGAVRSFPGLRFQDQMVIDDANAAHIVRCVNAHEALVAVAIAAAATCRAEWARLQRVDPRAAGFWKLGEEQTRAALALARGGE